MDDRYQTLSRLRRNPTDANIRATVHAAVSKYSQDTGFAAELAGVLASSGRWLPVRDTVVADVASTGGPSSLSTLLTPLFLSAAGAVVPKLGVPGRPAGGIDCLAQVPDYRFVLSLGEVETILSDTGYAHFLADGEMAPLDGRMFRLRQQLNAKANPALVTASLLSKKLAVNLTHAGLDIRVAPHGNFGMNYADAAANARFFTRVARILGMTATPMLTDGRFPYQPYIGRRESLVAINDVLSGRRPSWLKEHVDTCRLLSQACLPEGLRKEVAKLSIPELGRRFYANLAAQGADPDDFRKIVAETRRRHTRQVRALRDGFCFYPMGILRDRVVKWQKMYESESHSFPDPVGIILRVRPGQWVSRGTTIATVRTPEALSSEVLRDITEAIGTPRNLPISPNIEAIDE